MTLGEKIQQLRKVSGLSQEQLAEMVGVSRQAISKWETDQSSPEIEKVLLLSKAFSISTDELLGSGITLNAEVSAPQLNDIIQSNTMKRQFTVGWITAVIGLVLLICELFSLKIIQFTAMQSDLQNAAGIGFYENPMEYARIAPMPTIFTITIVIITLGVGLTVFSFIRNKKK